MNKVILIGNLTKDPDVRTTNSGTYVTTFDIAVQRQFKGADGQKQTDFIPIVVWRQLCGKYLVKGRKVGIIGELQTRSYKAKDGTNRHVAEVVASEVEFLTPKGAVQGTVDAEGFTDVDDSDLPF